MWAMLRQASLTKAYWAEAVCTANYILNRLPSKATPGSTPYEFWWNQKPNVTHLHVFGAAAYLHVPSQQLQHAKLSHRAKKGAFVGYSDEAKGYRILVPPSHRLVIARSIIFDDAGVVNDLNNPTPPETGRITSAGSNEANFNLSS